MVDFLKRKFPAYVETGLNLVDVRECAKGHVAALEKGRTGERYILGGEDLTLKQILDKLGRITGLPSPKIKLPYFFAFMAGVAGEYITGKLLRRRSARDASIRCAWGRKKCLPVPAKPSVNWDGRSFQWITRCSGPSSGSRRMDMPRIAIVAALEREVRPLIRSWRVTEKEYEGRRFRFFENGEAVLVCGGIGPVAARRASEAIIATFDPQVVCSAGFAGALDATLKVGDVVRPQIVINAGDGSNVTLGEGRRRSDQLHRNCESRAESKVARIVWRTMVDMEAAAVARAAESRVNQLHRDEGYFGCG